MEVISKKKLIKDVAKRWSSQYPTGGDGDKAIIYRNLVAQQPETEDEVEEIIGNRSWTRNDCGECGKDVSVLVQLGQEPDYESSTAYVCLDCLQEAIEKGKQA